MSWEPEPGASWPGLRRVFRLPANQRRVRGEVSDELWFHIQERLEELMERGLSRDQAEAEVRRRFGDVGRIGEELERIDATTRRRRERGEWLQSLGRDVRYALRGMARRPGYTAIIIATLALGIGANTAIFSTVNTVLLRPVPTLSLDRLIVVREDLIALKLLNADISPGEAEDLASRRDLFQSSAAFTRTSRNLTGLGEPQRMSITQTAGEFFTLFGVRPHAGRFYRPEDSAEGSRPVAVLSHALWQEIGGRDPRFIGRSIELNGQAYEVIGVTPPSFRYPYGTQIYTPFIYDQRVRSPQQRHSLYMTFVGRLAPGIRLEQLPAELRAEVARWNTRLGGYPESFALVPVPFVKHIAGELRAILIVLMGAVSFVVLIACANAASLQLVRAIGRSKELAVRVALGAGRGTIARQLLVESLVLSIAGGLLGVLVGRVLVGVIASWGAVEYRVLENVRLDARVLAFTALIAIAAGLAFGIAPALRAARINVLDSLKGAGRGSTAGADRHRFLRGSVALQMALTVILLMASTLTIRSLARLLATDPGFRPQQVMVTRVSLPGSRYQNAAARVTFFNALLERLRAIPGVQAVGLAAYPPFGGGGDSSPFDIIGVPKRPGEEERHANTQIVHGDYFKAMRIPLLRGRTFEPTDNKPGARVAIIDEQLAKQYFAPGDDPVGKKITQGGDPGTIIGVVGTVQQIELGDPPKATVYHYFPHYAWLSSMSMMIRSSLPPQTIASHTRALVRQLDSALPVYDIKPMEQRISESVTARRLAITVLAGFAGLSLLLAVLGIYGVMSYTTGQRTKELGIRVALGADPRAVVRMVLVGGLALAGVGVALGTIAFVGLGGALRALLYGVAPNDPATLA
ncbi:MAG: ABC transporter permease, partial [Gemmatimonadota bacterium]|nr:ABC transporter permease [Gemmatimonadota bacterium]